jgi:hypothetical protein
MTIIYIFLTWYPTSKGHTKIDCDVLSQNPRFKAPLCLEHMIGETALLPTH